MPVCVWTGYPQPLYDKVTGVIDKEVAEYWREHYDLSYMIKRDWATLGPKLAGKLHIYCGTSAPTPLYSPLCPPRLFRSFHLASPSDFFRPNLATATVF